MIQCCRVLRADIHAGPAADALVLGIPEETQGVFVIKFKCFGGTVFHTGGAAHAVFFSQACSVKQKYDHDQHDLSADDMHIPQIGLKKRNAVQGAVGQKITGEKGQPGDHDE